MRRWLCLSLFVSSAAFAAELTPELAAKIQLEQKRALEKVSQAHGNKKPSEMSKDERRQVIQEEAAAQQAVLDKYGVSAKDYARYGAKQSRRERAATQAAEEALEQKERDEKSAPKKTDEVEIQRGFDEKNPVELESSGQ